MPYVVRSHNLLCDIMLKLVYFAATTSSNLVRSAVHCVHPPPTV